MTTQTHKYLFIITLVLIVILGFAACKNNPGKPKPKAYFRIDLPQKSYIDFDNNCPYSFEYPEYSMIIPGDINHPCWISIYFPINEATIYITYKELNGNLKQLTEETRDMVYKHTIKASAIDEKSYNNDSLHVYGILYNLSGNVASNVQFYLTDSSKHFIRGSLYFNTAPNKDSLSPVLSYINKDIQHLIETTNWK